MGESCLIPYPAAALATLAVTGMGAGLLGPILIIPAAVVVSVLVERLWFELSKTGISMRAKAKKKEITPQCLANLCKQNAPRRLLDAFATNEV